jgi:hypothetical protein
VEVGAQPVHQGGDRLLVHGVGVGVQEAHRQRVDGLAREEVGDGRLGLGLVERGDDLAAGVEALAHLDRPPARDERRLLHVLQVELVGVAPALLADHEQVAEALGGDVADVGAPPLQHHVGGEGGGVHDAVDVVGRRAGFRQRQVEGLQRTDSRVVGRRERLGREQAGAAVVAGRPLLDHHDVGERAADVDAGGQAAPAHAAPPSLPLLPLLPSRAAAVAASSTVSVSGSTTTPYSSRAAATVRWPSTTSASTRSGSRSRAGP